MELLHPRWLLVLLTLVTALHADSRESAFQGRKFLGDGVWSRVLRITNDRAGPESRYPAQFHALVVEFEGILWLYTEFDGTQTLSCYAGQLAADKANLGPLLREIEPGLTRFEDVTDHPPKQVWDERPRFSCFLACVARWRDLQLSAVPPDRARLIAYYVAAQRQGHMVLQYWRGPQRFVFDPDQPGTERPLARHVDDAPLAVAKAVSSAPRYCGPIRTSHLDLRPATLPN